MELCGKQLSGVMGSGRRTTAISPAPAGHLSFTQGTECFGFSLYQFLPSGCDFPTEKSAPCPRVGSGYHRGWGVGGLWVSGQ